MARFVRRPVTLRHPTGPVTRIPTADGEKIADFSHAVLKTQVDSYDRVKEAVKAVVEDNSAPKVVDLVLTLVEVQVGEDEAHSPLLVSLVDDLKVTPEEVELAQDIVLGALDVARAISSAVGSGSPRSALWQIMGLVSQLVPELEQDILAVKAAAGD